MTVTTSFHRLGLGADPETALDLVGWSSAGGDYSFSTVADGFSWGAAEPVTSLVGSLMSDGDHVEYRRDGNREVRWQVEVSGDSHSALADGEARLRAELGKPNLIWWTAPDGDAPVTVFEVVASWMALVPGRDLDELRRRRRFDVTLVCVPHPRSAHEVVAEPMDLGAGSLTVVDSCDAASGSGFAWTGTRNGVSHLATTFWESGAVGVAELDSTVSSPERWTLTRTGSIDFTTTPYLLAEMRTISGTHDMVSVQVRVGSVTHTVPLVDMVYMASDYYLMTYDLNGFGVVDAVTFTHDSAPGDVWQGLFCRELRRAPNPSLEGRQQSRVIPVRGSERTNGTITVESRDGTTPTWLTLVHTSPYDGSGYTPPLRRWRVAGVEGDVTPGTFSGRSSTITTAFSAEVPTNTLPRGGYLLMAALMCSSATTRTIHWSTSTKYAGSSTSQGVVSGSKIVQFAAANTWLPISLGVLTLPSVRTNGGRVEVSIRCDDADVKLDEAWLFRQGEDCALSIVDNNEPRLWLTSPSIEERVPTYWIGTDAAGLDAHHPARRLLAQGRHQFRPGLVAAHVAANGSDLPLVTLRHFPRWTANAGL